MLIKELFLINSKYWINDSYYTRIFMKNILKCNLSCIQIIALIIDIKKPTNPNPDT